MNERPLMLDKLNACRANHDWQRSYILRNWDAAKGLWDLGEAWERGAKGRRASASLDTWGMTLHLHLGPADTFKAVEPVLAGLLERGWTPAKNGTEDDGHTRDYSFNQEHGSVRVIAWPGRDKCKRVLAGVETREKYKLVCEEEEGVAP